MSLTTFLETLKSNPETIEFQDTMNVIEQLYTFRETAFSNGALRNEAGQNNGSCKLFAFAKLQGLSASETLACFGHYYREDVLAHPEGSDHQNIRNFMQSGWDGIEFEAAALQEK